MRYKKEEQSSTNVYIPGDFSFCPLCGTGTGDVKLEMPKLKVSKELVWKMVEELEESLDAIIPNSNAIGYTAVLVNFLEKSLQKVGVEVEEKLEKERQEGK